MAADTSWKEIVPDGLFIALILFLITVPFYSILTQDQLWPGPGQNSPEISAYQISNFAHDAAMIVVVLCFAGYVLLRKTQPTRATAYALLVGYSLFSLARALLSSQAAAHGAYGGVTDSGMPFSWAYEGEILGGIATLIILIVSKKLLEPSALEKNPERKKENKERKKIYTFTN